VNPFFFSRPRIGEDASGGVGWCHTPKTGRPDSAAFSWIPACAGMTDGQPPSWIPVCAGMTQGRGPALTQGHQRTGVVPAGLVASSKRHGVDPFAYVTDVSTRIGARLVSRLDQFLPERWKAAHTTAAAE